MLSPDDLNLDPAFSFNAELPDVPKDHAATLAVGLPRTASPNALLTTTGGWKVEIPAGNIPNNTYHPDRAPTPSASEQVMDIGSPTVKTDNSDTIQKSLAAAGPGRRAAPRCRRPPSVHARRLGLLGLVGGHLPRLLRRRPRRTWA